MNTNNLCFRAKIKRIMYNPATHTKQDLLPDTIGHLNLCMLSICKSFFTHACLSY